MEKNQQRAVNANNFRDAFENGANGERAFPFSRMCDGKKSVMNRNVDQASRDVCASCASARDISRPGSPSGLDVALAR